MEYESRRDLTEHTQQRSEERGRLLFTKNCLPNCTQLAIIRFVYGLLWRPTKSNRDKRHWTLCLIRTRRYPQCCSLDCLSKIKYSTSNSNKENKRGETGWKELYWMNGWNKWMSLSLTRHTSSLPDRLSMAIAENYPRAMYRLKIKMVASLLTNTKNFPRVSFSW